MPLWIRTAAVRGRHTEACGFEDGKMEMCAGLVSAIANGADKLIFCDRLAGLNIDVGQVREQEIEVICVIFEHDETAEREARAIIILIAGCEDGRSGRRVDRRAVVGGDVNAVMPVADVHV